MQPCWHVCGRNLNIATLCAVSLVVHTSNISSCRKKTFSISLWLWTVPLNLWRWATHMWVVPHS
jgi:hypothetical protein